MTTITKPATGLISGFLAKPLTQELFQVPQRTKPLTIKVVDGGIAEHPLDKALELSSIFNDDLPYLIALAKVNHLGPVAVRGLVAEFESAKAAFFALDSGQATQFPVSKRARAGLRAAQMLDEAHAEIREVIQRGLTMVGMTDARYPKTLKEVADRPLVLYGKGKFSSLLRPSIAVVGTRTPTGGGEEAARYFADAFAKRGFNIVSGLAYGIDAVAHSAAVKAGGVTTAVLGHGLDIVYPSTHYGLAQEIVDQGGVLLSEFPLGTKPDSYHFPARNRIIAGLCHATLVVEAKEKGGALITAKAAFDQNRQVFAIPGGIHQPASVGCNILIRDNVAKLVMSPEDILVEIEDVVGLHTPQAGFGDSKEDHSASPSGRIDHPVLEVLGSHLLTSEELLGKLPEGYDLGSALLELEVQGMIARTVDGIRATCRGPNTLRE